MINSNPLSCVLSFQSEADDEPMSFVMQLQAVMAEKISRSFMMKIAAEVDQVDAGGNHTINVKPTATPLSHPNLTPLPLVG